MIQEELRQIHWLATISLLAFSILWLARWPAFPLFLDPYYHLLVAQQIVGAGGPILYEWWQDAPVGRPHLYPPLFHCVLAGFLKADCSPIVAIRLMSVLVMPALLASVYLTMRRLFSPSVALASLWMAMMPYAWIHWVGGQTLASGIALIELLWFLVAVVERRLVAGASLLALLFYTHLGFPWLALASVAWAYGLKGLTDLRPLLHSTGWGTLLAAPWLIHLIRHLGRLHVTARTENDILEFFPLLVFLAVVGALQCWKRRGPARVLLGLWLGFCLMAYPYTFRWVSCEGLLPMSLLAGYGVEALSRRMTNHWPRVPWLGIGLLSAGVAFAPAIEIGPSVPLSGTEPLSAWSRARPVSLEVLWPETTPFRLLGWGPREQSGSEIRLYGPLMAGLAHMVAGLTHPREIIWSNAAYAGGLMAVLAHRPMSAAMFYEVLPSSPFDPVAAAHLIVWFKIGSLPGIPTLPSLLQRYPLRLVAEDALAFLFRNPGATQLAQTPQAAIPLLVAFMLLCGLIGLILWDFHRTRGESGDHG